MQFDLNALKVGDIVEMRSGEIARVAVPRYEQIANGVGCNRKMGSGAFSTLVHVFPAGEILRLANLPAPTPAAQRQRDVAGLLAEQALSAKLHTAAFGTATPQATMQSAPEILNAASDHMRQRASTYDKPEGERSMQRTVDVFNQFHGTSLTAAQGWHFMQTLKDVRLFTRDGYHADSGEDGVAYAALKCEAMAQGARK